MHISQVLAAKGSAVIVIGREATVRELVALLEKHNLGAVVVSSDGKQVEGIVSERDVVRQLAAGPHILDSTVEEIMSTEVHTCTPKDSVNMLMSMMTEQRVRHIPVLDDDGALCGIVSIGDVVKSRIGELEFERDQLEGYVSR
ncbi:CBS domain-containing protein [Microlunatus panaciterrae]|uniref:CBS domain-containing protein n=1 Tax=Microlunatus panaciterrae TaxID=400768 RepID=A0ABS2RDT4_9ACTN|nr:CBS domain-containing protein [Microlunatus panaciterrae]MBM7797155.1 CBS domain-containing protein [Microlunatus panaciterrae]